MAVLTTVVHPRTPARRGAARATRWWAKAWVRAIEEASYSSADLSVARAISRSGRIGQIRVAGTPEPDAQAFTPHEVLRLIDRWARET